MSDGGRGRASRAVEVLKSSQKWSVQRSAVRSIAWLDVMMESYHDLEHETGITALFDVLARC
jgi:hypothetical protein